MSSWCTISRKPISEEGQPVRRCARCWPTCGRHGRRWPRRRLRRRSGRRETVRAKHSLRGVSHGRYCPVETEIRGSRAMSEALDRGEPARFRRIAGRPAAFYWPWPATGTTAHGRAARPGANGRPRLSAAMRRAAGRNAGRLGEMLRARVRRRLARGYAGPPRRAACAVGAERVDTSTTPAHGCVAFELPFASPAR